MKYGLWIFNYLNSHIIVVHALALILRVDIEVYLLLMIYMHWHINLFRVGKEKCAFALSIIKSLWSVTLVW